MGKTEWEAEEARWAKQIEAVVGGVRAWRAAHPRATFREIAEAIDAELNPLRAQMLAEAAATSPAARFTELPAEERPQCATCGGKLIGRGRRRRRVVTRGDATVELEREYGVCAACEGGVFPLDEELELGTERFDPWLVESIVLLGTVMPFERVPLVLDRLLTVPVGVETARRLTEAIGETRVTLEAAEAERVRATLPMPVSGPAVQQLSLDGAMVPLVGGAWAEVKTLALGEVERTTAADGSVRIRTTALSYFSRLTDAETFREQARGELYRRGTAAATVVCAVQDGAEWQQRFVDYHRPDAVRILDFPHALEHLGTVGRAVFGAGSAAFSEWLGAQAHTFKHGEPDRVLTALRTLDLTDAVDPEASRHQAEALTYFEKRRAQLAYADFRTLGYPIGSGVVESANKLVVEARLKGSGMRWDRASVSPMVSLRDLLCSDRWAAEWPVTWRAHLAESRHRRPRRAQDADSDPDPAATLPAPPTPQPARSTRPAAPPPSPTSPPRVVDGRPTAAHPWRKPFFRSRQRQPLSAIT